MTHRGFPGGPAAVIAIAAALMVGITACGGDHADTGRPASDAPVRVAIVAAGAGAWPDRAEVTGTLQPLRRATPSSVLLGTVEAIGRREGDRVRTGDLLARVESREAAARVAAAEANVAAARAGASNARVMMERLERLHARDAATTRSLDDARTAWEAAEAQVRAAEETAKAAAVWLDHARVTAPFDGIVTERRVEVGDTAAPGVPLFVVDDLSRVKVEVQIAESDLAGLGAGDAVTVAVPAAGADELDAKVAEILPAGDPATRTFTVRALLDNPDRRFRPGMFVRMTLVRGAHDVVTVPEPALVRRGPLTGVFVVDADRVARLRWVTTGASRNGTVEVLTGLVGGEAVVSPPPPGLADGQQVEAL